MDRLTKNELQALVEEAGGPTLSLCMLAHAVGREMQQDPIRLDLAAAQTLLHSGTVYAVPPAPVPADAPVAALFRY